MALGTDAVGAFAVAVVRTAATCTANIKVSQIDVAWHDVRSVWILVEFHHVVNRRAAHALGSAEAKGKPGTETWDLW